jgi:hypothetical protein
MSPDILDALLYATLAIFHLFRWIASRVEEAARRFPPASRFPSPNIDKPAKPVNPIWVTQVPFFSVALRDQSALDLMCLWVCPSELP